MATDNNASDNGNGQDLFDLKAYEKRRFILENVDLADAGVVAGLYQELIDTDISCSKTLRDFVDHRSELDAAVQQADSILYIGMTCQTDDTEKAAAFTKFVSEVVPAIKPLADVLDRKYLEAKDRLAISEPDFDVYDRTIRSDVDLFREDNVPLQTEDELLSQEYQSICGKMTVEIDGQEYTMQQAAKLLQETDRPLREKVWRATTDRRLADADKFDEVFEKMLGIRGEIATNAGLENFRDYQFVCKHRFDYTPDDCKAFHKSVEEIVVPLLGVINKRRSNKMGLDKLRPWDTSVDPLGREPLKPFENESSLIKKTGDIFSQIDGELGEQFANMAKLGLLDLTSRKGKAPGGYQTTLTEARKPFIFANAVGINFDIVVLLHEGGHAFHAIAGADLRLYPYRHAPTEFCEVASMSMELMAMPFLSTFYNEQDAKRARILQLERSATVLPAVALVDKFQHWIYENPNKSINELAEKFREMHNRFTGKNIDYSGLEKQQAYDWHRILHLFQCPMYYIEYGIAQIGALQMWLKAKTDMKDAVKCYRRALALGGSRPLPQLFEAAEIKFDMSAETIEPLVKAVAAELEELEG